MVDTHTNAIFFPPPQLRTMPAGERVSFSKLCGAAAMAVVVSGRAPDVRLHGEAVDFKAVAPGRVAYCFGLPLLPTDPGLRARMVMHKLAYQCMNWAAREIVRAARTSSAGADLVAGAAIRRALAPNALRILGRLRETRAERVSELAAHLGIAQPHVSRALRALFAAGLVRKHKRGRETIFAPDSSSQFLAATR